MSEHLKVPCTNHSFADVQLLLQARKVFPSRGSTREQRKAAKLASQGLELRQLEEIMGVKVDVAKAAKYLQMFAAAQSKSTDLEHGGEPTLTYNQFREALSLPSGPLSERIFQLFDSDENGTLDVREFIASLAFLTNRNDLENAVDAALVAVDSDGDGLIKPEEFLDNIACPSRVVGRDRAGDIAPWQRDAVSGSPGRTRLPEKLSASQFKDFLKENPVYLSLLWGKEVSEPPPSQTKIEEGDEEADEEAAGQGTGRGSEGGTAAAQAVEVELVVQ
mmetsp:Transcript_19054/g.53446  ORF Transcript_19054/g.53446 Transcript_19054/m.53446 type:complete len:276 (+) Transcript_19054:1-828(+)